MEFSVESFCIIFHKSSNIEYLKIILSTFSMVLSVGYLCGPFMGFQQGRVCRYAQCFRLYNNPERGTSNSFPFKH
jgi:hypothetical protein